MMPGLRETMEGFDKYRWGQRQREGKALHLFHFQKSHCISEYTTTGGMHRVPMSAFWELVMEECLTFSEAEFAIEAKSRIGCFPSLIEF